MTISYSRAAPSITTNMTTTAGLIANTYDGGELFDGRPLTRDTGWTFQAANYPPGPGVGTTISPATTGNLGCFIQWDFGAPASVGLLRLRSTYKPPLGKWQLKGSNDNTNFYDIGTPFELGIYGAAADGLQGNNVPLPYGGTEPYRLYSPDSGGTRMATLFYRYFKIVGVSDHIDVYPYDKVAFSVYCLDLCLTDQPGVVVIDAAAGGPSTPIGPTPEEPPEPGGPPIVEPVVPEFSDYRSPYSRGSRGQQGGLWPTGRPGNLLINKTAETFVDRTSPVEGSFDGDMAGGPYYGVFRGNGYWEFEFDKPIMITALKFFLEAPPALDTGTWQVHGSNDDFATNNIISTPQSLNFTSNTDTTPDTQPGFYIRELLIDVLAAPYKKIRLHNTAAAGTGRLWNEMMIEVAHSPLEGGDRRTGDNAITIGTNIIDWYYGEYVGSPVITTDLSGLVDGVQKVYGGQVKKNTGAFRAGNWTVGDYLQFRFPRAVILQRGFLQIADSGIEHIVSGQPTVWGKWRWRGSDDGVSYANVGSIFTFGDAQVNAVLDAGNRDQAFGYWRLQLVDDLGTPISHNANRSWLQVEFDLIDIGDPTPFVFNALFVDDATFNATLTQGAPANPYAVRLTDDSTFTATPTLHYRANPVVHFTTADELDVFSALGASIAPQLVVQMTGR